MRLHSNPKWKAHETGSLEKEEEETGKGGVMGGKQEETRRGDDGMCVSKRKGLRKIF